MEVAIRPYCLKQKHFYCGGVSETTPTKWATASSDIPRRFFCECPCHDMIYKFKNIMSIDGETYLCKWSEKTLSRES